MLGLKEQEEFSEKKKRGRKSVEKKLKLALEGLVKTAVLFATQGSFVCTMSYNDTILHQPGPSSQTNNAVEADFVRSFRLSGGELSSQCKFVQYETMGTGMIAAETIQEGELLFSIPRHMLLNLRNSILPEICKRYEEKLTASGNFVGTIKWEEINTGWIGLMVTMMWECFRTGAAGSRTWEKFYESHNDQSWLQIVEDEDVSPLSQEEEAENDPEGASPSIGRDYRHGGRPRGRQDWGFFFRILPNRFDTPMFWNDDDLAELKGTNIIGKIGKEEATKDYREKVEPFIRSRPQIFFGAMANEASIDDLIAKFYSLDHFHIMGSRILSRSFHVKDVKDGVLGEEGKEYDGREMKSDDGGSTSDDDDDEEEEEEEEDIEQISMVPMADMLNARSGCDNAHLFYKSDRLEMRATQTISKGEQIWNTYGDPPSSDLLRRYGYVDLGNAADVVELNVQDLITACLKLEGIVEGKDVDARRTVLLQRIQWACSLGLDEEIPLQYPFPPSSTPPFRPEPQIPTSKDLKEAASELSEELLILARVLCLSEAAFGKLQGKDKLPNPRIDAVEEHDYGAKEKMAVAELVYEAIEERKRAYTTTEDDDERILYPSNSERRNQLLSINHRNALVVRLSEKRILSETQKVLDAALRYVESKKREGGQEKGAQQAHKKMRRT
jgi:SET domain-containing protein 6